MLYKQLEESRVHCLLCSQHCHIEPGKMGKCGVRENRDGQLQSLVYGKLIAQHIDPIEKKPLFHFFPGTTSYSIATAGCNFTCLFCQNSDISQAPREHGGIPGRSIPPEMIAEMARREGCATVSYTYTEPTIFLEYALDVAACAKERGLANVFVSNGYMTEEALDAAAPVLDAANIDLKAFNDRFYREQCGARLKPVLNTLERMKQKGVWLEVTTLLVPGLNDNEAELKALAQFLVALGAETPWHISRFYPTYRMTDRAATPVQSIKKAREIGLEAGLHHVYTGNIPGDRGESTYCHSCGAILIRRIGYSIDKHNLRGGACAKCATPLEGIGLS